MAKIKKRGNSYQIDYLDPHGKRVRLSFTKKKEAEAELGKRVSLIAEKRYLDVKKEYKTTFGELVEKYTENFSWQPAFSTSKRFWLENFKSYLGKETKLSSIAYVDIEGYSNHLRNKLTRHKTLRRAGSINREMSCLRHLFRKSVSWDMMEKSPFSMGDSLLLKENNMRKRFLTEDEIGCLLKACEGKSHLRRIVLCALNTGMRRKEILTLKWNQLRSGYIYLEKTKTDERREIPINENLAEVFREIRQEQGLSSQYVFLYGEKIKRTILRLDRAFKGAVSRAKIENFKFHDLRHTFASQLVMRGASLKEVQELLGHKTMTMTVRYAHLAEEHKKKAVSLLNGLTAPASKPLMSQNVTNRDSHHAGPKLTI